MSILSLAYADHRAQRYFGFVAILDALGAARYTDSEIAGFLDARGTVLRALHRRAEDDPVHADDNWTSRLKSFTFNDTVVLSYASTEPCRVSELAGFVSLLRKFVVESMQQGILYRGALSVGTFYASDRTNTVLGPAVTDAASWYDRADWIGLAATPHASAIIEATLANSPEDLSRFVIPYDVPLKGGQSISLYSLNWPRGFFVKGIVPEGSRIAYYLRLAAAHGIPLGAESKHLSSRKFFKHSAALLDKAQRMRKKQPTGKRA